MSRRVKYTRRPDDSGWLKVLLSRTLAVGYLPEFTRVEVLRDIGDRVHFRVADGNTEYLGQEASLKKVNANRLLSDVGPTGPASVQVRYLGAPVEEVSPFKGKRLQQFGLADFARNYARVTLNSVWGGSYTPIPPGNHRIMAPDRSHANQSTSGYRSAIPGLKCTDVWFPIQLEGQSGNSGRYIHAGHLSEGCVTVYELTKWTAMYEHLIASRVPGVDGKFVGTLIVEK